MGFFEIFEFYSVFSALIVAAQHDGGDHGRPGDCPERPKDTPEDHICQLIDANKPICKCFPPTEIKQKEKPWGQSSREDKKELKAKANKKKQVIYNDVKTSRNQPKREFHLCKTRSEN